MLPTVKKHLFMRKRHSTDKGLFSEVSSSRSLKSSIDGCFRKANVFRKANTYFRFEYKIDNF